MKLSASQAAKEVGKSVPTITRAIKSGRLSAKPKKGGGYDIDPAELFRVFPAVTTNHNATPEMLGRETPNNASALQVEVQMLRERVAEKDAIISDLQTDRNEWRRQATSLLTDQRPKRAQGPSWWPFRRRDSNE